jgi:hypothetical protein
MVLAAADEEREALKLQIRASILSNVGVWVFQKRGRPEG